MKLVVVTVGFDEKLPLRGILKVGLDVGDVVALVYSMSGGEHDVKKVVRAIEVLKEIIGKAKVSVVEVEVSGTNFYDDVARILRFLKEQKIGEVVAVLTGGMRLLAFEVLFALLMFHRHRRREFTRCDVLLMREDGLYDITLPIESFYTTSSETGLFVMRIIDNHGELKRSQLVRIASREAGVSESAVYKAIRDLVKKRIVVVENDNVKLTEIGRLLITILGE
ncbi:MAG: hypothetical protein QXJ97_04795 [Desulfurococcaceae archaeon]